MPTPAGSAISGAATGASTGATIGSIIPGIGTLTGAAVGGVIGGIGGLVSGIGTEDSQKEANRATALAAAQQSAQSFLNYLSSRGVNLQQIVSNDPRGPDFWNGQYAIAKSRGDRRDFNTWLVAAIQGAPSDPIWETISSPSIGNGAQNTTLPAWAVDAQGNPLQPSTLKQLVDIQTGANDPARAPIANVATVATAQALLDAHPEIAKELADAGVGNDGRTPAQWLVDHITQTEAASGGGRYTDILRNFAVEQSKASAGPAGTGSTLTLDPAIAALIPRATTAVDNIFNGNNLATIQTALGPVASARTAGADAAASRVNELRGLSGNLLNTELGGISNVLSARTTGAGNIYNASVESARLVNEANISKLADLLGVRRDAAEQIYNASQGAATGLRDARTTGAQGIYDAESLRADTFNQAAQQAVNRLLSEQAAERARRGFQGGSSGSDIVRARLLADYTQRGAGARADAGVNYQTRLSDAGIGYATDIGRAGVGRATTFGQANEADAVGKLAAAVEFARANGLAGVNRATSVAGATEQDAIAQLQAKVADATRRLGYLTSDADIAKANADLANAQDQLNAIIANQNQVSGSLSTPFQLASSDLALKGLIGDQKYADIDALIKRLNSFQLNPASGPALTTSTPTSVINGGQIAGGALTNAGSVISNISQNKELTDLIKLLSGATTSTGSTTAPNPVTGSLLSSPNFLAGSSVFAGPNG